MKYHKTTQKEVAKFFKKDKEDDSSKEDDDLEKRTPREEHELPKGPMFQIVDPIPTIIGDIGKFILNEKNAHKGTRLSPSSEFKILKQHCLILKKINIFFLSDIYLLSFNKKKWEY